MTVSNIKLFILSALILFLELLLIRWIGTEVNVFAYLQNAVLIYCFLGLGMGCLASDKKFPLHKTFHGIAIFSFLLSIPYLRKKMLSVSLLLSVFHDFVIWDELIIEGALERWLKFCTAVVITFLLSWLIWKLMLPLGAYLARLLKEAASPVQAYSINLAGSLTGIWLFTGLSLLGLPPSLWFIVLVLLSLPLTLSTPNFKKSGYGAMLIIILLPLCGAHFEAAKETAWSPYQKLELVSLDKASGEYTVLVNNTGYQQIQNDSFDYVHKHFPQLLDAKGALTQYDIPGRLVPDAKEILIVGTGTGNNIAGALRTTKAKITAVEIDPAIVDFGRRYHPEHPYSSEQVEVIVDDARAVFMNTKKKYDLIVFGLLDSHTTPALTNARLDHFVYTKESLQYAAKCLSQNGILALIFLPQRPYILKRLGQTLAQIFGTPPKAAWINGNELGWGGALYLTGNQQKIAQGLANDPLLATFLKKNEIAEKEIMIPVVRSTTDDWPYLYLEKPSLPFLFVLLAVMLIASWYRSKQQIFPDTPLSTLLGNDGCIFAAMGAGFALFEVYGVNQAAIFFGSSWIVNSVVISVILGMILLANSFHNLIKISDTSLRRYILILFALLIGIILCLYAVNLSDFVTHGLLIKLLISFFIFGGPMFISGLCFALIFEKTTNRGTAMGANLFGALIGGILQLSTFLLGIKCLLLLAVIAYLVAFNSSRVLLQSHA